MYKVSVVIPIYNVEKYIVRCAESLFSQTLDDIQFIFVDDASPDKSVTLLEQTLERFPKQKPHTIILHHAHNLGLPTARATGLARVEAPYVAHCDSDDYVEPTMYEKLYNCAIQNDSDMVICGRKIHCIDGREYNEFDKLCLKNSFVYNFLYGYLSPYVWTRLTKTDIYRRVLFPTENYLEDWVQTAQLLTYSFRITFSNDCLYHYVRNPFSITNTPKPDTVDGKLQQCIKNYNLMHDFIMKHHQINEKDFSFRKEIIRRRFLPLIKRKQYMRIFPEINYSLLFNLRIPWSYRASHLFELLGLYSVVKRIYDFIRKNLYIIRTSFYGHFSRPDCFRETSLNRKGVLYLWPHH